MKQDGWTREVRHRTARVTTLGALVLLLLSCVLDAHAAPSPARADVVVLVDTSTSMTQAGMDPERTSLLVAKLLADIVPGDLATIRSLDLAEDRAWLPSRDTGKTTPCNEDPSKTCNLTEPIGDWEGDVRKNTYGALARGARGDPAFKRALEKHLEQRVGNSLFDLGFRAAQGVFDRHAAAPASRTVVWLSDGRSEREPNVRKVVAELRSSGVSVGAIVLGKGDIALAQSMGLDVRRASTPAELMKAFAGVFRGIVQAPYEWDRALTNEPSFEMNAHVDEAWVVVYGDASLSGAWLTDPSGKRVEATHGADVWATAGAYRVAYLTQPPSGRWTVGASAGGPGVAYAVVQRSALGPQLLHPRTAIAGTPARVVAAVTAGQDGTALPVSSIPPGLTLEISIDGGPPIKLVDDGTQGDAVAGDGQFSAMATFPRNGQIPVRLRLHGDIIDRTVDATIDVQGTFHYKGGPLHIDLGELREGSRSCRPLVLDAEHTGRIPFRLDLLRSLPADHALELTTPSGRAPAGGGEALLGPGETVEICLVTNSRAPSSSAADEPWVSVAVAGSTAADQTITVHLKWSVRGLSFWQRWGWLILAILGILFLIFIVVGYLWPRRFSRALAVAIAPDREELEDQAPQPVAQWKGVGIGFYRHARAYVHANYRLSGQSRGALAVLSADAGGTRVSPGRGQSLYRETLDGEWEPLTPAGRVGRGDVYRSGERGPYFRVASARRA